MTEEGQFVLNDDGTFALRADGTFALFDSSGECEECCGGSDCNFCPEPLSIVISGMTGNAAAFNGCHEMELSNPPTWTCADGCFYQHQFLIEGDAAQVDLFIPSVCESDQPVTGYIEAWLPGMLIYCGFGTFEYDCRDGGANGITVSLTPEQNCGTEPSVATIYESACP